jgi:hypothetical protein
VGFVERKENELFKITNFVGIMLSLFSKTDLAFEADQSLFALVKPENQ